MIPQPHKSRWKPEEIDFMEKSISEDKTLEEIAKVISQRSLGAILTKANNLGYGNYHNKSDRFTYFKSDIKHKTRSCNSKFTSTTEVDNDVKVDTGIIPKTADNVAFYEGSITYILKSMKENQCLHL